MDADVNSATRIQWATRVSGLGTICSPASLGPKSICFESSGAPAVGLLKISPNHRDPDPAVTPRKVWKQTIQTLQSYLRL